METLGFVRKASEIKDGVNGFLYIHHWKTGWQELVFKSKDAACAWLDNRNGAR